MKVLTLRQPWAWALFAGKDIENRTWKMKFRGPLAIHAAKGMTKKEYDEVSDWMLENAGTLPPFVHELTFGAIIGVVEVVDCVTKHDSPWFQGPYGLVIHNPVLLEYSIPHKGMLGLWTPKNQRINDLLEETWQKRNLS